MAPLQDNYFANEQINASGINLSGSAAYAAVATAGTLGETVKATVAAAGALSVTTATPLNITSISLSAGDWDITGTVDFLPAASTSLTQAIASISLTSATLSGQAGGSGLSTDPNDQWSQAAAVPAALFTLTALANLLINATTTVYLVAQATFTVSTMTAYGSLIARRRR